MIDYKKLRSIQISKSDCEYLKENLKDEQFGQVLTAVFNYFYFDVETEFNDTLVDICYQNVLKNTKETEDNFVNNCKRPGEFLTDEEIVRSYKMVGNVKPEVTISETKDKMANEIMYLVLFKPGTKTLKSDEEIKNSFNQYAPHLESKYKVQRAGVKEATRILYDAFKTA